MKGGFVYASNRQHYNKSVNSDFFKRGRFFAKVATLILAQNQPHLKKHVTVSVMPIREMHEHDSKTMWWIYL